MQDYFGHRSWYFPLIQPHHVAQAYAPQGVDDVMALLLALSASPEELELAMISVTYGNVPLQWYVTMKIHRHFFLYSIT